MPLGHHFGRSRDASHLARGAPQPYHTGTVNLVTDLALVEVLFAGSLWVPLSAIQWRSLMALCFRQLCTMPDPKSGGGRGYSFRCLKWLLLLLVVSSQTASVSGVKVDASVAQQASRVSSDTKHGSSFVNAPSTAVWSKTRKRSFKRACTRAARNPEQRAMYRGRWIKAGDGLKGRAAQAADFTQSSSAVRLRIFNWNCGGLTTLRFEEMKQWLHAQLEHTRPHPCHSSRNDVEKQYGMDRRTLYLHPHGQWQAQRGGNTYHDF